jgi:SAM-dependent methyltransferase
MNFLRRWKFHTWYQGDEPPPWDTGVTPPEVVSFVTGHPPGRALDLGCGTGTNVIYLAKHGWQATGIDFAWSAIRAARLKARQAGVKVNLRVGDVTRLRHVHGPFDLILDIGCFHNVAATGRPAYRTNLERLLAPGGTYLLYVHLRPEAKTSGHGVLEAELVALGNRLRLVSRQDGFDRDRPSAWLTFTPRTTPA